jgi:hypothetical protein
MILYHSPGTRAFPVLWALEDLGFPYELKSLDLGQGRARGAVCTGALRPASGQPRRVVGGYIASCLLLP